MTMITINFTIKGVYIEEEEEENQKQYEYDVNDKSLSTAYTPAFLFVLK
jgi:hypothetical protein